MSCKPHTATEEETVAVASIRLASSALAECPPSSAVPIAAASTVEPDAELLTKISNGYEEDKWCMHLADLL